MVNSSLLFMLKFICAPWNRVWLCPIWRLLSPKVVPFIVLRSSFRFSNRLYECDHSLLEDFHPIGVSNSYVIWFHFSYSQSNWNDLLKDWSFSWVPSSNFLSNYLSQSWIIIQFMYDISQFMQAQSSLVDLLCSSDIAK